MNSEDIYVKAARAYAHAVGRNWALEPLPAEIDAVAHRQAATSEHRAVVDAARAPLLAEIERLKSELDDAKFSNPITMPYSEANERFSAEMANLIEDGTP